ncbi:MAG TPA: DNA integrity scanning diadenylate cyclase DisA [Streptosporangiaceae bacterium]|nr:DNA integrity scanning diadenylate cyclase DisA [Streptosporangiaceae bacterium]
MPAVSEEGLGGERRRAALAALAPGTALRDGLERILRGSTGALIVLGYDQAVADLCSGGFDLDVEFSATRLRELAKMDGAIVLDAAARTIVRAAVQLVPDPDIQTDEAGTRHRTAQRAAKQTGHPVISVSKSMRIISLFIDGRRFVIEDSAAILSHANQALATLERYRRRLDEVSGALSALEIEDLATIRDVTAVAQRLEMVRRIAGEIEGHMVELGTDGRLLALHLDELVAGTGAERVLLVQDYVAAPRDGRAAAAAAVLARLEGLPLDELLDPAAVAAVLGFGGDESPCLDERVSPHGYRLLARVPRIPRPALDNLIEHFGGLQKLLAASVDDLHQVPGVGASHARSVREGLSRLAESSILDRYV